MKWLISIALCCVIAGCSKDFSVKEIDGVKHISNTITVKESTELQITSSLDLPDTDLIFRGAVDNDSGKVFIVSRDKVTRKRSLTLYSEKMESQSVMEIKKGKGPGEFGDWVPFYGFHHGDIYILDGTKRTFEVFGMDLKLKDTILLNGDFNLYRGTSFAAFLPDGYIFSPTVPYYAVRTNSLGEFQNGVMTDLKVTNEEERMKMYGYNANIMRQDNSHIYITFIEGEDRYIINSYDLTLKPVWQMKINDPLNVYLCAKQIKVANGSVQPVGTYTVVDMVVDEKYIYVLRGCGGFVTYSMKDDKYTSNPIPEIKNPYLDVLEKTTGRYVKRIQIPFISSSREVRIQKKGEKFYLFVLAEYDDKNVLLKDSNKVYICKEQPSSSAKP